MYSRVGLGLITFVTLKVVLNRGGGGLSNRAKDGATVEKVKRVI